MGLRERLDGWADLFSGKGTQRDKSQAGEFLPTLIVGQTQAEELYRGDAIAAKVVDLPVGDMTREGFEFKTGDADAEEAIAQTLGDLCLLEHAAEAERTARISGGSLLILGIDDGQEADQPLNEKAIQAVRFVSSVDRYAVSVLSRYTDPKLSTFGQPEVYLITTEEGLNQRVHATRTIRLHGVPLPRRLAIRQDGWGDSVYTRFYGALRGYHAAHNAAGHILGEFIIGIYRLEGLAAAVASSGEDAGRSILTRFSIMDMAKGLYRAILLDKDEVFERNSANVSGLADLVSAAERRLCAETSIPHTLLLGESPGASLGEQGGSQQGNWYDHVAAQQEARLRPVLERVTRLVILSKEGPTRGVEPESWSLTFNPLWQMDAKEQAEVRKLTAETDAIYIQSGVLAPDEVAEARFGVEGWSPDLVLDFEARELPEEPDATDPLGNPAPQTSEGT